MVLQEPMQSYVKPTLIKNNPNRMKKVMIFTNHHFPNIHFKSMSN